MKKGTKIFVAALALVLVFGAVVGGTLAWLMDKSDAIVNTFTVGNVKIDLSEIGADEIEEGILGQNFKMVPGDKIAKAPMVTVEGDSEDCWLFVKVDESANLDDFITWAIGTGWIPVPDNDGVFYREVLTNADAQDFYVLSGSGEEGSEFYNGCVTVNDDVSQSDMDGLTEGTYPTLTFTAYAVQKSNVDDVATAWTIAKDAQSNS